MTPPKPPLAAAAGVVLLTLILLLWGILAGVPMFTVPTTDLTLPPRAQAAPTISADVMLQPLHSPASGDRVRNPFNLRQEAQTRGTTIPLPPPPLLSLPQPPPLPLPQTSESMP